MSQIYAILFFHKLLRKIDFFNYYKLSLLNMNKYILIFVNILVLFSITETRNWIFSLLRELKYFITIKPLLSYYDNNHSTFPKLDKNTKKVVIMLHGLHASPGQFINHIKYYKNNVNDDIKIYTPFIKEAGHTSLENSTIDILDTIEQYIDDIIQYNIKIIFVGISNGGRIAVNIMNILNDKYTDLDMYLTTLGSPLKGTMSVSLLRNLYLIDSNNYPYKELTFNNTFLSNIMSKFNTIKNITSKTRFYGSINDIVVFPITVCTLENHDNVVVNGYGHNSLVTSFCEDQMDWIYNL